MPLSSADPVAPSRHRPALQFSDMVKPMFLLACLPCGSILGVPIRVHWSAPAGLFILAALSWSEASGRPHRSAALYVAADIVIIAGVAAMVLTHELAHALAARVCGVGMRGIYLHIFGGLAVPADPLALNLTPPQKLGILAAGPASNFLCCAFALVLAWALDARVVSRLLVLFAQLNLGMGIFNLLPIWPLDGGQLFHAFLLLIRAKPRMADWATLTVTLLLGIPISYEAWAAGNYWALSILLVLLSAAAWLLTATDGEATRSTANDQLRMTNEGGCGS